MKRRLLVIAICLLLGAVVNVAVAWGCALGQLFLAAEQTAIRLEGDRYRFWRVDVQRRRGAVRVVSAWLDPSFRLPVNQGGVRLVYGDEGPPPASLAPHWAESVIPDCDGDHFHCRVTTAYGWPRSSLWCAENQSFTLRQPNTAREVAYGVPLPVGASLPTLPAVSQKRDGPVFLGRFLASLPQRLGDRGDPRSSVPFDPQAARMAPLAPIWPAFAINTIFYATLLWLPFVLRRFLRLKRGLCPKCAYPMGESAVCTECGCGLPKRAGAT